jgi:Family of unknown function (DUF5519)
MGIEKHGAGEQVRAVDADGAVPRRGARVSGARGPAALRRDVASWPGVETAPHRFGGTEFRLGRRELGHLHGDRIADLPFPRKVRDQLIADGRARAHHVLPDSGWVTASLDGPNGAGPVIELFSLSYARAVRAASRRDHRAG